MTRLRSSHEALSREELLDLVCHLERTYVLEQTIPFDIPIPERAAAEAERNDPPDAPDGSREPAVEDPDATPSRRFARLVEGLKRRTGLPQLDGFSIQEGRAVLVVDNQKITFGDRVTVEFVPVRGVRRTDEPAAAPPPEERPIGAPERTERPQPQASPPPAGAAPPTPATRRPAPRPAASPQAGAPVSRPGPAPAQARAEGPPKTGVRPEKDAPKGENLDDVDHIVERFKRLDLD